MIWLLLWFYIAGCLYMFLWGLGILLSPPYVPLNQRVVEVDLNWRNRGPEMLTAIFLMIGWPLVFAVIGVAALLDASLGDVQLAVAWLRVRSTHQKEPPPDAPSQ